MFSPPCRWHRVAYSVHGKSVTLFLDCQEVATVDLRRGDDADVSTDGVTVFGRRLLDRAVFEVGLCPSASSIAAASSSSSDDGVIKRREGSQIRLGKAWRRTAGQTLLVSTSGSVCTADVNPHSEHNKVSFIFYYHEYTWREAFCRLSWRKTEYLS